MKHMIFLTSLALVCGSALAQQEPPAGKPAATAQMKVDDKKMPGMPMEAGAGGTRTMGMGMDMKAMDTNGDGMISKKEWQAHHNRMWGKMKSRNGSVPMADVEAMLKGGPN